MKKIISRIPFLCAALAALLLFPAAALPADAAESPVRAPVLMYHGVSDETWGLAELFVRVGDMDRQLGYLAEHGYTALTFEELDRAAEFERPILLTFDDGYRDNYDHLFPLLQKYNMKATLFVITGDIGNGDAYLTADMVREMAASGLVSVQSHTRTHADLRALSREDLRRELAGSADDIEALTGRRPIALSYPCGHHSAAVREAAAEVYRYGVTVESRRYALGSDPLRVGRLRVSRGTAQASFAAMAGG